METANKSLKMLMRGNGLPYWRVAEEIGVCENTLIRWLRTEVSGEKRTLIEDAVHKLIAQEN